MQATAPRIFKRGASLHARLALISLLSVVVLVADARFRMLEQVRSVLSVVVHPFKEAASLPGALLGQLRDFSALQSSLRHDNERLRGEAMVNAERLQRLDALETEMAHLKRLIDARPAPDRTTIIAELVYESRDMFSRKVVIDKGSARGLGGGQVVIDHEGVLGQITRVFPLSAEVSLITDKNQSVPVSNVRTGQRSVTFGTGRDGVVELRFIPVNADIQVGDLLVTSGIDGVYPAGLPVAKVSGIERDAASTFARISCAPVGGVSRHTRVAVLSAAPAAVPNSLEEAAKPSEPRSRAKRR
jgi:rod shape-determining protein MreC